MRCAFLIKSSDLTLRNTPEGLSGVTDAYTRLLPEAINFPDMAIAPPYIAFGKNLSFCGSCPGNALLIPGLKAAEPPLLPTGDSLFLCHSDATSSGGVGQSLGRGRVQENW